MTQLISLVTELNNLAEQSNSSGILSIYAALIPAIINGCIGIFTIVSTAIFALLNYRFAKKSKKTAEKIEAYSQWYLPIRFKLSEIQSLLESFRRSPEDCIFSVNDDPQQKLQRGNIQRCYSCFVEFVVHSKCFFCNAQIDTEIADTIEHMQFLLINFNDEEILQKCKQTYPIPNYRKIISDIDRELSK